MGFYLMGCGVTGVEMVNSAIGKHVENLHVSAQNTKHTKNKENIIIITKNTYFYKITNNEEYINNNYMHKSIFKIKTNCTIAISDNISIYSKNSIYNTEKEFKEKYVKKSIITNNSSIAINIQIINPNIKITNLTQYHMIIAIKIAIELIIKSMSIAKLKTSEKPLIGKTLIENKPHIIKNYIDNSLVDK